MKIETTKTCQTCNGKGFYLLKRYFAKLALPRFIECEICNGLGYYEKSQEQIELETEVNIENSKSENHANY